MALALREIFTIPGRATTRSATFLLYRACLRELPRTMVLYDIDMPLAEAKRALEYHFRKFHEVRDDRAKFILLGKGYMELEETLMQWKQKSHLLRLLNPPELLHKDYVKQLSQEELLALGITGKAKSWQEQLK